MASEWYIRRAGKVYGPFTAKQIRKALSLGGIDRTVEVSRHESGPWEQGGRVRGLLPTEPPMTVTRGQEHAATTELELDALSSPKKMPLPIRRDKSAHCPNCGSESVHPTSDLSIDYSRAFVGTLLFGEIGGAIGAVTGQRAVLAGCLSCGNKWSPEKLHELRSRIEQLANRRVNFSRADHREFVNYFMDRLNRIENHLRLERQELLNSFQSRKVPAFFFDGFFRTGYRQYSGCGLLIAACLFCADRLTRTLGYYLHETTEFGPVASTFVPPSAPLRVLGILAPIVFSVAVLIDYIQFAKDTKAERVQASQDSKAVTRNRDETLLRWDRQRPQMQAEAISLIVDEWETNRKPLN